MLVTLKHLLQILENLEQGLAEDGSMTNITQENRQGRYSFKIFFTGSVFLSIAEVYLKLSQDCHRVVKTVFLQSPSLLSL